MREKEKEVAECDPSPALLHKEDVKYVALFSKIGGCRGREVRLRGWVVGCCSSGGIQ